MAREFWLAALFVAATTIGAGVFALPYLAQTAGWAVVAGHLVIWAVVVGVAQAAYWDVLAATGERQRLAGLAARYLSPNAFRAAFVGVLGGLLLALVAYLVLAVQFVQVVIPGAPFALTVFLFWLAGSFPLFIRIRSLARLEAAGTALMAAIILGAFAAAPEHGALFTSHVFVPALALAPFGAVLFSLAGWTALEPAFEAVRRRKGSLAAARRGLGAGIAAVVVLYLLFLLAVRGSTSVITPDTLTGLAATAPAVAAMFALLGLFALWTSYVPILLAAWNALRVDAGWSARGAGALVLLAPPTLVAFGVRDFLSVVSIAGGVFLGAQYVLILLIARRALRPSGAKYLVPTAVFALATLYELWSFVVH